MILLTMNEWLGPGKKMTLEENLRTNAKERIVLFVSSLDVNAALEKIKDYQRQYNEHYRLAVNFRLIGIAEIHNPVSINLLTEFGAEVVEDLANPGHTAPPTP